MASKLQNYGGISYCKKTLLLLAMNTAFQLSDPSFQPQLAGKCDLHLEVFPGGIHAAVVDKGQDQLKSISAAPATNLEQITAFIEADNQLTYHFRKVKVALHHTAFTFIPDELFDKSLLAEYAKFIGAGAQDVLACEHLRSAKCQAVFAVPAELAQLLNGKFHRPHYYPSAAACIEAAAQWAKNAEGPMVLINVLAETFEAACFKEGKFEGYNTFPKRSANEFNYFLLHLIEGWQLDPAQTEFILAGDFDAETEARLQQYTAGIRKADKQHFIKQSETFGQLEPARFYSITALSLCE